MRLGQGIGLGSAAMLLFDAGATIAFWIILCTNAFIWFSIAKLNGGRFMDGYKPGFPFYLLYTRPVPTVVVRRRHHGVRRDLLRGVVPRIRGSRGVRLRPAAAVVLCDPVDPGLTPCVYLRPMVDPEQNRPVGRIASGLFAVVHSAPASCGVAAAGRALDHRERSDDLDWRRVVRSHGRRRSAAAPRRFRRGRAPERAIGRIPGLARFPVPVPVSHLRQRRRHRCGSSSSPADCPYCRSAWRWR